MNIEPSVPGHDAVGNGYYAALSAGAVSLRSRGLQQFAQLQM
jgi:hypothetical protein